VVLELPLEDVSAGRTRIQMERRGISFETDAFVVEDHVIWGATARIVELLLRRLRTEAGGGLALLDAADGDGEDPRGGSWPPPRDAR
jgi:hypothetical protein